MAEQTRDRMIAATVDALQHRGVSGMSFTEVLARSGAARGAIYHHFPGGKAQLVAEAAADNGRAITEHLAALPGDDPTAVLTAFLNAVKPAVEDAAAGGGCAVAAVTVDSSDELRRIAASMFDDWIAALATRLTESGLTEPAALDLATASIGLLEGAHVLCRAAGNLIPFTRAARALTSLMAGVHGT